MKKIILCVLLVSAVLLAGCSTMTRKITELNDTLKTLDELGLKRVSIPGRVTHTEYTREGNTSTLTHTNPALVAPIEIVRERPAVAQPQKQ